MEATLHALSGILLRAIPTFLLVIFLHFYLKYMFFKPLDKVLHARYEATEGARQRAAESLEKAAAKTAEYEAALRAARSEVYQTQEQLHRRLQGEQSAQVHQARAQAEAAVRDAKAQLAAEIAQAKADLGGPKRCAGQPDRRYHPQSGCGGMKRLGYAVLFLLLLVKLPAVAQQSESEAQKVSESTGVTEHGPNIFWGWVNFILLAGGLGYLVKKNAGPYFAQRSLEIRKGMADAEAARAASDAKVADARAVRRAPFARQARCRCPP